MSTLLLCYHIQGGKTNLKYPHLYFTQISNQSSNTNRFHTTHFLTTGICFKIQTTHKLTNKIIAAIQGIDTTGLKSAVDSKPVCLK